MLLRSISLMVIGLMAMPVYAGDAAKGKEKSAPCAACHGATGISAAPVFPNLAGQKEEYLKAQMKAFKDGTRKNDMMAPMVAGLSDEDIDNLAAFFASQSCK
jgi:cytochrome c553